MNAITTDELRDMLSQFIGYGFYGEVYELILDLDRSLFAGIPPAEALETFVKGCIEYMNDGLYDEVFEEIMCEVGEVETAVESASGAAEEAINNLTNIADKISERTKGARPT